jgi:hypothetical protein
MWKAKYVHPELPQKISYFVVLRWFKFVVFILSKGLIYKEIDAFRCVQIHIQIFDMRFKKQQERTNKKRGTKTQRKTRKQQQHQKRSKTVGVSNPLTGVRLFFLWELLYFIAIGIYNVMWTWLSVDYVGLSFLSSFLLLLAIAISWNTPQDITTWTLILLQQENDI